jgi:hypothetical protein
MDGGWRDRWKRRVVENLGGLLRLDALRVQALGSLKLFEQGVIALLFGIGGGVELNGNALRLSAKLVALEPSLAVS